MNNDEEILKTLQKMLANQEQSLEVQRQAVLSQQIAIKNQLATGRIYRAVISVAAILLAIVLNHIFVH